MEKRESTNPPTAKGKLTSAILIIALIAGVVIWAGDVIKKSNANAPTDNVTAIERKMADLRQTEKDYYFIMEDNRVARVSEVKKQGEDTVKVFYSVKGDWFTSHKRISDLETHIQKVIKKSDVIEWQKAKAEYDRDPTKPIGFDKKNKPVQGVSKLKLFHKTES